MNTIILLAVNSLKKVHWINKKYLLNILWCIFHTSILSIITVTAIGTSSEFIWFPIVLVYIFFYFIITSILLGKIVEDEIDNIAK